MRTLFCVFFSSTLSVRRIYVVACHSFFIFCFSLLPTYPFVYLLKKLRNQNPPYTFQKKKRKRNQFVDFLFNQDLASSKLNFFSFFFLFVFPLFPWSFLSKDIWLSVDCLDYAWFLAFSQACSGFALEKQKKKKNVLQFLFC